ncbi:medium-chain fatty acid-CoA ligase faa2 [Coemansia thaxteri]|uniref:Medium-chain fatty acid-CoA ligase faa2 n=1 Tax=Coemansia thaxteri TaxID=2663907 RepID=A0A9W8EFK1_9FUNG|nr:medium-chain fatty acid-CoA ligase faa2 [Coemansia thaxteri]KAJ2003791.1 medium-chain fatty acid-CoA ligase faa2 [Coemansia thaxteri]KAJ2470799.1 medium-chain fatty acid-CoA ligase faa2 [Coemansia sp. RSA 2322]KAJ2486338.1 medium-chain fatty acid-CoA ligase faa2 [Coemansia sp. RSA 2320]
MMSSIEVPGAPAIPGETKPRIASTRTDGQLMGNRVGVNNMHDNFLRGMELAGKDSAFIGHRPIAADGTPGPYEWLTYGEVNEKASAVGSGFAKLGVAPKSCFGIFASNCVEWTVVEQASYVYDQITVPMYDTLGIDAIKHMATETEMSLIAVAPGKLGVLFDLWPSLPLIKTVVVMGEIPSKYSGSAAAVDIPADAQLISLDRVATMGKEGGLAPRPESPAGPSDTCTICYTSGTTGTPKGVVLSHMGFLSIVNCVTERIGLGFIPNFDNSDVHLSILPLAHCLERCLHAVLVGHGARIGFNQGDVRKIMDDISELKPSILVGVPRIFNRIHDQVWAQVKAKGGIASALFHHAYNTKKENLKNNTNQHWLWDRVVFKPVRQRFGGRLRLIISGSAPISLDVLSFLRIAFSTTVLEGYGLTETSGPCGLTIPSDMQAGNVGCTLGNCMFKLVSVPDMNYFADSPTNPSGEICVKGHNVFTEYYKRPDLTAETKSADGWLHTGDIGTFDSRGNLVIIDRKKNMFKLSQGEYVAPERVEVIYTNSPLIDQTFIHGDSLQSVLVAVVVPNEEFLRREIASTPALTHLTAENPTLAALCLNASVISHFISVFDDWGRKNGLKGFEIPKNLYLEPKAFSVENDILTPTFKVKRPAAKNHYNDILGRLYAELNAKPSKE